MTDNEELKQMEGDWNMSLDLMDGYRKRWEAEKAETARLRAALAEVERERDEAREARDEGALILATAVSNIDRLVTRWLAVVRMLTPEQIDRLPVWEAIQAERGQAGKE